MAKHCNDFLPKNLKDTNSNKTFTRKIRGKNATHKIATRNVQTLHQAGKLQNVVKEMESAGINLLGISEYRCCSSGTYHGKDYKLIYSGGKKPRERSGNNNKEGTDRIS